MAADKTLRINRIAECELQTLDLMRCGDYACCGLELPWKDNQREVSRIPAGTYPASYQVSPTFGPSIRLHNVPGRTNIVIHFGNFVGSHNPRTGRPDSLGCPLPGEEFVDIDGDGVLDVSRSKIAVDRLIEQFGKGDGTVIVSDRYLQKYSTEGFRGIAITEGFLIKQ